MAKSTFLRTKEKFRAFYEYLVETGLLPVLQAICLRHTVTLHDVFMDVKGSSVTAARIEMWWRLMTLYGKSPAEIERIFQRHRDSIAYAMRKLQERANEHGVAVAEDTVTPLAKTIAAQSLANQRAAGERVGRSGKGSEASLRARKGG